MADYINRKDIFPNGVFFANENDPLASLDELIKRIWSIPAADVAPVRHARWDMIPNTYMSVASKNGSYRRT